ncbi:uncharacterized protein LOC111898663 [Lactuca sativa]|uniref:uncharacterized protein LOC111898663 n=1 Tax=Lactuca sativa TaxID=4236 RepID=UPI0022AF030A|nr:uncharacterized protein LOC111898663 [Lactuca sativa]
MVDILGVTDHLNTILQRKDQDIVNAMNQLKSWIWKMHIIMDIVVEDVHKYDLRVLEVELGNYIKDVRENEQFNDLKSIGDIAKKMVKEKKHIIFPKIYLLVRLALILPVVTTSMEPAFSAMKLINTDIRNKMSDQFFSDSLVSYVEKNVLQGIGNDAIVKVFQDIRPRRVQS